MSYSVAVVGIGAVGSTMLRVLKQRGFPAAKVKVLATRARTEAIDGTDYEVRPIAADEFDDVDIALFAGSEGIGGASEVHGPAAAAKGVLVVDNAGTFRMYPNVPLVVPEVNFDAVGASDRLIANPNCSTIQMVVALAPLHRAARIKRIVVSTYQSVSGRSGKAVEVCREESRVALSGAEVDVDTSVFPRQIAFNCLPHIDSFCPDGYTKEEWKMVRETRKILGDDTIQVSPTTVRVPALFAHAESVNVEFKDRLSASEAREILAKSPGIIVMDDPANGVYPTQLDAEGRDETFVGRIREDATVDNGLNLWVVADNLRKGAATNAIQIAERAIEAGYIEPR
jgi:aspartate-semialdehyde dehydrogenase